MGAREIANGERLAGGLLVVFALGLPFEARLFRLGPLQITTVELLLYFLIAAWGLHGSLTAPLDRSRSAAFRARMAALRGDPMAWAAGAWTLALFASAAFAPSYRVAAFKFALRSLSGILVFFVTRTLAATPAMRRRVVGALIAGALLSAIAALVEAGVPGTVVAWRVFRDAQNFDVFGLPRPSGVFGFPTIGAMYWEAVLPVLMIAPSLGGGSGQRRRDAWLCVLGCALLVAATLCSATRSGLAGIAVAVGALLALGWRRSEAWMRWVGLGILWLLVLSIGLTFAVGGRGSLLGQRLLWWRDGTWYRAAYEVGPTPPTVHAGEAFVVPVTVRNTGALPWSNTGARRIQLGYHWERRTDPSTTFVLDGARTELPSRVPPGGAVEVRAEARGPLVAGDYVLRWDLFEEGTAWFSDRGIAMPSQTIAVVPGPDAASAEADAGDLTPARGAGRPPTRTACWRAAVVLWRQRPLFGVGADNFRRRYEGVLSPAPSGRPYTDTRIHANSLYFETLADLGLAGVLALACVAAALLALLRRHLREACLVGIGCCVAAGAFFVHGLFDYFFEFTPLFGLFWLLVGLASAFGRASESEAPQTRSSARGRRPSR